MPESSSSSSSSPGPCGTTLRFLDNENEVIPPSTEALNVSNYVTDDGLPQNSGFNDETGDPDNFRLEVEDAEATGNSVSVTLQVGSRSAISYTLDKKSGNKFRGEFLRLVTDSVDDSVQGSQTVLCALGETVVITYSREGEECEDTHEIGIGRPTNENYNGTNQRKHDIRELAIHVVVFSKPGATNLDGAINATDTTIAVDDLLDAHSSGPIKIEDEIITYTGTDLLNNEFTGCTRGADGTTAAAHADNSDVLYSTTSLGVPALAVNSQINRARERLAQATIALDAEVDWGGAGAPGKPLPGSMLDGFTDSADVPWTLDTLTADEKAIVSFHDADPDSIDIYFVEKLFAGDNPTQQISGRAYPESLNNSGDSKYKNFAVINDSITPFTLAHEILHILLNPGLPHSDVDTSLIYAPTSSNTVDGTKRIGPYAGDGDGEDDDTFTIRDNAEDLP